MGRDGHGIRLFKYIHRPVPIVWRKGNGTFYITHRLHLKAVAIGAVTVQVRMSVSIALAAGRADPAGSIFPRTQYGLGNKGSKGALARACHTLYDVSVGDNTAVYFVQQSVFNRFVKFHAKPTF